MREGGTAENDSPAAASRRRDFVKRCAMGGCGLALAASAVGRLVQGDGPTAMSMGFANDPPRDDWPFGREAEWYEEHLGTVTCRLCPHQCVLRENDRGFCRVRAVKDHKLLTLVYGNPCSLNVDPMEKKPLYHFLPGRPILSTATAGCNLRCLNCQNREISQSRPEDIPSATLTPQQLVGAAAEKRIPAIAYTYSEPIIFYEYARDCCALAREKGIRNVLVTAGYIQEAPLRALCKVTDAANVDLKSFSDRTYRRLNRARLAPVLRALEILREEGVWVEITRLIVSNYSDDMDDVARMCEWIATTLGPDVPLHISRFHPAYRLQALPPTPVPTLERAHDVAKDAGLRYVYIGNVPGRKGQDTLCPSCGRQVIAREGFQSRMLGPSPGQCACGETIAGVWS